MTPLERKPTSARRPPVDEHGLKSEPPPSTPPPEPDKPSEQPPSARARRGQLGQVQEGIETMLGGVALMFYSAGDPHCAQVFSTRAKYVAGAWTELAEKEPAVKKALLAMVTGGAWGQVIFATASIAVPVMQHHSLMPNFPNPWTILAGDEAAAADQAAAAFNGAPQDDGSGAAQTPPASDAAEAQRRAAEARRREQATGGAE